MKGLAALFMTLILTAAAAAGTIRFRSAPWPPLQLRLAKTGDKIN
jgi:hypothetical protein